MRRLCSIVASLLLSVCLASPALAGEPLEVEIQIDTTARLGPASALCGFDIFLHAEGVAHWRVFYDQDGVIIREIDTFPTLTWTLFAPSTGMSYTTARPAMVQTDYTNGGAVGSAAVVTFSGLVDTFGPGPGIIPGRISFNAVVVCDPSNGCTARAAHHVHRRHTEHRGQFRRGALRRIDAVSEVWSGGARPHTPR